MPHHGQIQELRKGGPYGEYRAQAYNEGLRAHPPAESRGTAPIRGSWKQSLREAEHFLTFQRQVEVEKLPSSPYFVVSELLWESNTTVRQT